MPAAHNHDRAGSPTVREIAELVARLRTLSTPGRAADPAERAVFLADKDALMARITETAATKPFGRGRTRAEFTATATGQETLTNAVLARAAGSGYVLVGPSARTWRRDPRTGLPAVEVPDAEHQAVRDLLGRYRLGSAEPEWVTGPDGRTEIHTTVTPLACFEQASAAAPGHHHGDQRADENEDEDERRAQVAGWHTENEPAGGADTVEDEWSGRQDGAGW